LKKTFVGGGEITALANVHIADVERGRRGDLPLVDRKDRTSAVG
jgi:hypothetical protein